ncbi:unnamed protein product [Phytomonas sp. Hart1]|nr:unnamed protein product [Phytomonas sp. Hart1]|eukprot:CCW67649.1 unnamed protein product [Phytomonas sp. isolate Hart1]
MKIVLIGAPGSGKGTQSSLVRKRYDLSYLATGDMLRDAVARKTPQGILAKNAMDAGKLVDDEIVFDIVVSATNESKNANGCVLDGFPRTVRQATMMENANIHVDKAIEFSVPDDVILKRTSGRWIHQASGRTYHEEFRPPKTPGVDDVTGEPLIQRPDDRFEVAKKRLELFKSEANTLAEFYKTRGVYVRVDANRIVDEVYKTIVDHLDPIASSLNIQINEADNIS